MGSDSKKDWKAYADERPQHRLTLPEYYIGKYPVTNEQYAVFVAQTKGASPSHWQGGKMPLGKEKHPVVNVSWHDARAFCTWVSKATGGSFRLASEAEWEKAARGVDGWEYPWGNWDPTTELCNSSPGSRTPVDRYPKGASPYGALQMAGNVWEWTRSLKKPYPYNPADGREDESVSGGRVMRGGSYDSVYWHTRCAGRGFNGPDFRFDRLGFRVVCVSGHHASGRGMDSERQLTLEDRKAELEAERGDVVAHMKQIETHLAEREEGKQGIQQARGGRWRLLAGLAGLAAIIATVAIIAVVADVILSRQGPGTTSVRPAATLAATSTLVPVATFASDGVILTDDIMTVTSPIEMELVQVPAGEFLMGSDPAKDSQAIENEQPQHWVNLPEYYIGKYEVTNAQYQAFVQATGNEIPSHWIWGNGSIPAGKEEHPVVNVSWRDAIAFTDWLSATTGLTCRLPTEAEWEKTCRGTEGLIYPWRSRDIGPEKLNYYYSSLNDTTPVGSYSPAGDSPYGAADMAGNVWEWTGSLWGSDIEHNYRYPYDPTDGREGIDPPGDVVRVMRGGSFTEDDKYMRCAYRGPNNPGSRLYHLGFRVVCVSAIMTLDSGHSGLWYSESGLDPEYSASGT